MKISVNIIVKNEEENIIETLNALKNQTKKPDEVIIVDGGSTDKTKKIIKKYKGLPIKLIEWEKQVRDA